MAGVFAAFTSRRRRGVPTVEPRCKREKMRCGQIGGHENRLVLKWAKGGGTHPRVTALLTDARSVREKDTNPLLYARETLTALRAVTYNVRCRPRQLRHLLRHAFLALIAAQKIRAAGGARIIGKNYYELRLSPP